MARRRASATLRPMNRPERLAAIMERVAERGNVDVEDLTHDLDVSSATVRRDLQALHEQRLLERTHGGAVAIGGLYELPSATASPAGERTSCGSRRPRSRTSRTA